MSAISVIAGDVVERGRRLGVTIATGESLTAGGVAAAIASVPGASAVLRGGVIAYSADVKQQVLGVSPEALAHGIVSRQVAVEMAQGCARLLGATIGIGTTGVAGPEPHDGAEVGTVWIAVTLREQTVSRLHEFTGDRQEIRRLSVEHSLLMCLEILEPEPFVGE
jgi:nicotinamide-nucleotide amidase